MVSPQSRNFTYTLIHINSSDSSTHAFFRFSSEDTLPNVLIYSDQVKNLMYLEGIFLMYFVLMLSISHVNCFTLMKPTVYIKDETLSSRYIENFVRDRS